MSKWYMTVGYPGGEFAAQDDVRLMEFVEESNLTDATTDSVIRPCLAKQAVLIRPCPPDVAEWLDFPATWGCESNPWHDGAVRRRKVPGGWLLVDGAGDSASQSFIPVPHTANITVLEAVIEEELTGVQR